MLGRRDWGHIRGLIPGKQRALKGWLQLAPESRKTLVQRTFPLWVALLHIAGACFYFMNRPLMMLPSGSPRDFDAMLSYVLTKHTIEWKGVFSQGVNGKVAKLSPEFREAFGSSTRGSDEADDEDSDDDRDPAQKKKIRSTWSKGRKLFQRGPLAVIEQVMHLIYYSTEKC